MKQWVGNAHGDQSVRCLREEKGVASIFAAVDIVARATNPTMSHTAWYMTGNAMGASSAKLFSLFARTF